MSGETIESKLVKLQAQQDSYVGMKVASYILVIILAIISILKSYSFNMKRRPTEPVSYTYQKIAAFSLIAILIIHFLSHHIF